MKKKLHTLQEDLLVLSLLGTWRELTRVTTHGNKVSTQSVFCQALLDTKEEFKGRSLEGLRQRFSRIDRITLGNVDTSKLTDNEKLFLGLHRGLENII